MFILPQVTVPVGGAYTEKKTRETRTARPKGRELDPSFKRAQAKREHLKVALLAERHARGPDGQRMRSPQLARCSRDIAHAPAACQLSPQARPSCLLDHSLPPFTLAGTRGFDAMLGAETT